MKLAAWLNTAQVQLERVSVASARLDAQLLASHVLGLSRAQILASPAILKKAEHDQLDMLLKRRITREPLAYITGSREFYGHSFIVNHDVLIPRPETELLVECTINTLAKNASMLEIGTGSGAIAIAAAKARPDLTVTATDVSEAALAVARRNQVAIGTAVTFQQADMFQGVTGTYDCIAANLPYVPYAARRQPEIMHEPDIALYADDDGLALYRRFFDDVSAFLAPTGWIIIEASPTQFRELGAIAAEQSMQLRALSEYIFTAQ